jgi:hypothetical protein
MNSCIFWDITPYSQLKVNPSFGGKYRLHLQGRRINQSRNQRESRWQEETGIVNYLDYIASVIKDIKEFESVGGIRIGKGRVSIWRISASVPLCSP